MPSPFHGGKSWRRCAGRSNCYSAAFSLLPNAIKFLIRAMLPAAANRLRLLKHRRRDRRFGANGATEVLEIGGLARGADPRVGLGEALFNF